MRRWGLVISLCLAVGACDSGPRLLSVNVRTALEPGVDFDAVVVEVRVGDTPAPWARETLPLTEGDFRAGARVADFEEPPLGRVAVRVQLARGTVIVGEGRAMVEALEHSQVVRVDVGGGPSPDAGPAMDGGPDASVDAGPDGPYPNSYVTAYTFWSLPDGDYYNIDIDLTVEASGGDDTPYFWGHQMTIAGSTAYIGLQSGAPRDDGSIGKVALFSVWGATVAAPGAGSRCVEFSGEGVGRSCRNDFDWRLGRRYTLRVWVVNDETGYGAWIIDTVTGEETHLGTILPPSSGRITGSTVSFFEYFGGDFESCVSLPPTRAVWSVPTLNAGERTASWNGNSVGEGACAGYRRSEGMGPATHSVLSP